MFKQQTNRLLFQIRANAVRAMLPDFLVVPMATMPSFIKYGTDHRKQSGKRIQAMDNVDRTYNVILVNFHASNKAQNMQ